MTTTPTQEQKPSKLTCIQTLTPPATYSTPYKKPISKADEILFNFSQSSSKSRPSPVWNCTWSHDGTILATCHGRPDPAIRLWKYLQGKFTLMATIREDSDDNNNSARTIRSVKFAPTPSNVRGILAAASFDGTVSIWEDFSKESSTSSNDGDMANGWECTAQLEGHENEVKDVAWNATGTLLASCGRDKSVWIWECFLPGTIGGEGNGSSGPNGGEGDFECLAVLQSHEGDVKSIAFAPSHGQFGDGDEILLSASYDDTIRCWAEDAGDWYCALTLKGVHSSTIWSLGISASGMRMFSGSADKSLAIWRCYTAAEKQELMDDNDDDMNNDNDNEGMHSDGVWKCVGKLPDAHSQPIYSIDCSGTRTGHGRIISGGGDDCINVYREINGGTTDSPLFAVDATAESAHTGDVNCVKWHPIDGKIIASAGDDGFVKIWSYDL